MTSLRKRIEADIKEYYSNPQNTYNSYLLIVDTDKKRDTYYSRTAIVRGKVSIILLDEFLEMKYNDLVAVDRLAYDFRKAAKELKEESIEILKMFFGKNITTIIFNEKENE